MKKIILNITIIFIAAFSGVVHAQTNCTQTVSTGQSISAAISTLTAGQTLCISSGTFHETITISNKNGTDTNPIIIRAADPSNPPIIDGRAGIDSINAGLPSGTIALTDPISGKGFTYAGLVSIVNSSYVTISGIVITASRGTGVLTQNSHHITFDNLDIHNSRGAAFRYYASTNGLFMNSKIYHNANFATYSRSASQLNWPVIISTPNASESNTFRNLTVFENWGEGIESGPASIVENSHFYDNYALQIYANGQKNVTVRNNFVHCSNATYYRGGAPSAGIVINKETQSGGPASSDIKVYNNYVVGCGGGLSIWAQAGIGLDNGLFAHNTLVNIAGSAISVSTNATHTNVQFINNIVQNQQGINDGATNGILFSNNIWFGSSGPTGNNNRQIDPQLVNPTASIQSTAITLENYKLKSTSPAINTATNLAITSDYYGTSRPQGQVSDIGAHEFTNILVTITPLPTTGVTSTITPTPTQTISCPQKPKGDADCKANGTGKSITITDFEIWRKEYFSQCSAANASTTSCQTNDDGIGTLMDANFDTDTTVTIADFEIWRKGYFGGI